ncbi:25703_t:CDS:2 [Gigaspora margarita]|uniref:25703_t:CDS:1 n=1 Tax=Gigaspora margarita TaxID=4874 RepID=A0ABN7VCQ3_GIGMA|nr:25703_t:CDS:2 [Gigaspora margarita]
MTKFWREHLQKTVQFETGEKTIDSTFSNPIFINVGIGSDTNKTNFKEIIGNCWCNGIEINCHNYYKYISSFITKTQLIRLPGYSFNHTCSYWVQQTHQKSLVKTNTNDFVSSKFDQQPLVSTMQDRVILCFKKTLANSIKEILSENIPHTINSNFNRPTSITKLNHGCETVKPIYMIHPVSGSCIFYRDIISSLENFTVYGFEYPGLEDSTAIEYHSIQDLSEIYLKDLLKK